MSFYSSSFLRSSMYLIKTRNYSLPIF